MNIYEATQICFLSQLLPEKTLTRTKGMLKTSLREYHFLIFAMEKTIAALQEGKLDKFDALVGDRACEIRTLKIAMIAPTYLNLVESVQIKIMDAKRKIEEITSKNMDEFMRKIEQTFQDFLNEKKLDVSLTKDELFLLMTYILSVAKRVELSDKETPLRRNDMEAHSKLEDIGKGKVKKFKGDKEDNVSFSFLGELVKRSRSLLSETSVQFIQEQARFINDQRLMEMCSDTYKVAFDTLVCLPMFWTYKTILAVALKEEIPIVILAHFRAKVSEIQSEDKEYILFIPDKQSVASWLPISITTDVLKKVVIVVQGVVCSNEGRSLSVIEKMEWKKAIAADFPCIILAGAADHDQYLNPKPGGGNPEKLIADLRDEEFEHYKSLALEKGFSEENPSLFFIQHVYPDTLSSFERGDK